MERFMRQHSYMSGLSSACPLALLANFAAWTPRMNGALRRLLLLYFQKRGLKKRYGRVSFGSVFFVRIKKMNTPTGRKTKLQLFIKLR